MQVTTLGAQLGLDSELVDWYRDATSVPLGHLVIDLLQWTDDRLRYCTNSGSAPSKFYIPGRLKHLWTLDNQHKKILLLSKCSNRFPANAKATFFSVAQKGSSVFYANA